MDNDVQIEILLAKLRELHNSHSSVNQVRDFWANVDHEARARLQLRVKKEKQQAQARQKREREQKQHFERQQHRPPKVQIKAKPGALSLGWTDDQFVFGPVIPFCSHAKRSSFEIQEDNTIGINRCVFSNLFVDDKPLAINVRDENDVESGRQLLCHAANYQQGLCAESYYMAAKCVQKADADFIMKELSSSYDVCRYGKNTLHLTRNQRDRLVELGAPADDFQQINTEDNDDATEARWLRGKYGKLQVRNNWLSIRHGVFLYILRHKFCKHQKGSATRNTMQALEFLIREEEKIPLMVEHRMRDGFWGDAADGSGFNVLGKTITQTMLEVSGKANKHANELSTQEESSMLYRPFDEIAMYEMSQSKG